MKLGVCYYPEHWPESVWEDDARRMAEIGIVRVRIGEFAWSRIEPEPGVFDWGWLDRAVETLHAAGLEIVMGTPTATPPKWLIDRHPEILAHDQAGRARRFGSRRHYDFSSPVYRDQAARITHAMATRYGAHPALRVWQTDNEYGCHDTIESTSPAAAAAFHDWLAARYGHVAALNTAWGNVFWSMEYRSFSEVDLPNLTVTEANPSHRLDYQRFSSDQVVHFNRMQADILRAHSPGRDIVHNFMGYHTAFDHFAVGADLDAATWDSYPLGFLEWGRWDEATKARFARQGHPDLAAFHHDLYRAVGRGRWQVMEQQPGPVNWAPYNPAPLPGMVRAWTWEAFAHGAEVVSYFRWRQAPFAQEQMHAGLLRPDSQDDIAAGEARQVAAEIALIEAEMPQLPAPRAAIALVFDYQATWVTDIQPQGKGFSAWWLAFETYSAFRSRGFDIDIIHPGQDLSGYGLILLPCLPILPDGFVERLRATDAVLLIGPRTGSKTADFQIPKDLPPGPLSALTQTRIGRVESLRPNMAEPVTGGGAVVHWLEHVSGDADTLAETQSGQPVWCRAGRVHHLAGWPDTVLMSRLVRALSAAARLVPEDLPDGLRLARRGALVFAINYAPETVSLEALVHDPDALLVGQMDLPPAGVAIWRDTRSEHGE